MFKTFEFNELGRLEVTIGLAILGCAIGYLIGVKIYHNSDYEKAIEKIKKIENDRLMRKSTLVNTLRQSNMYDSE